ncbi:aminotransferase class I/II-fold pyridoxal phosphate-dependent enzyme [Cutibacterium sp. WCA-380-WT-3A]|uniref:Aminotransferase class I/II-fold pyridoxal phosphate-dependent enzyme n=1 Tax=Cutibacterium porci TaxID=2605781 RepID=A0A7K0J849_9ACTN|nr:6-carboxyhexanoate--CoA ligase [Cutibacterium porci]MSS46120.1 aminotransferase class I/II-fold pyridoxal phosphate-dependent enzyme [Cutibacterium porci]
MRASGTLGGEPYHVSGAESLVASAMVEQAIAGLTRRAFAPGHSVEPRHVRLSLDQIDAEPAVIPALPTHLKECPDPATARQHFLDVLSRFIPNPGDVLRILTDAPTMRGAALVEVGTGRRLEADPLRGVRVTRFGDLAEPTPGSLAHKKHHYEAVLLASKVAAAPGVLAEFCMSDDPDYTRGYMCVDGIYTTVTNVKADGDRNGGRVILIDTASADPTITTEWLERQPVLIGPTADSHETTSWRDHICQRLNAWRDAGLDRNPRIFCSPQSADAVTTEGPALLFSSSDYLGLSTEPRIQQAMITAAEKLGCSSGGSRLTTGTSVAHQQAEHEIASWLGYPQAVLMASGYQANLATLQLLASPDVTVISDADNHASLIDGCRLARARTVVVPHADLDAIEACLNRVTTDRALVLVEGVYSMGGDATDVAEVVKIAHRHGALAVIDDAHGIGTVGPTGRGVTEGLPPSQRPDIVLGTASKALGVEGGFVCVDETVAALIRNCARGYAFSSASSPAVAAAIAASVRYLRADTSKVQRLQTTVAQARCLLAEAGLIASPAANDLGPIIRVPVGSESRAVAAQDELARRGLIVGAIRYPAVARGRAILRICLTARHTEEHIRVLVSAIRDVLDGTVTNA